MAPLQLRVRVRGYVQGVNFRWHARRNASLLGLAGYVRNCGDGTVEVVAEGERDKLAELVDWLRRGPSLASVEGVEVSWRDHSGEFTGFEVRF